VKHRPERPLFHVKHCSLFNPQSRSSGLMPGWQPVFGSGSGSGSGSGLGYWPVVGAVSVLSLGRLGGALKGHVLLPRPREWWGHNLYPVKGPRVESSITNYFSL